MASNAKPTLMRQALEHPIPSPKKPIQASTPSSNGLPKHIQSTTTHPTVSSPLQPHNLQQSQQQFLNFNYLTNNQQEIQQHLKPTTPSQTVSSQNFGIHSQQPSNNHNSQVNNQNQVNGYNTPNNNCKLTDILSTRYSSGTLKFMRGVQAPPATNSPNTRQLSREAKKTNQQQVHGNSPGQFSHNPSVPSSKENALKLRESVSSSIQQDQQQKQNSASPRTFSTNIQDKMIRSKFQTSNTNSQQSKKDKDQMVIAPSADGIIPKRQKSLKVFDSENEPGNNQSNLTSSVTMNNRNFSEKNLIKSMKFTQSYNTNCSPGISSLQGSYNFLSQSNSNMTNQNVLGSSSAQSNMHQAILSNISNGNNGNLPLSHYHISNQQSFGLPVNIEAVTLIPAAEQPQTVVPSNIITSSLCVSSISTSNLPGRFESFGAGSQGGRGCGVSQSLEKFKTGSFLQQQQHKDSSITGNYSSSQKQSDIQQYLHPKHPPGNQKSTSKKNTQINDQYKGRNNKKMATTTLAQSSVNPRNSQQFSNSSSPYNTELKHPNGQSGTTPGTSHSNVISQLGQNGTQLSKSAALSAISQRIQQNLNSLGDHNQYQPLQGTCNSTTALRMHTEYTSSRDSEKRDTSLGINTRSCISRNSLSDNFKLSINSLEMIPVEAIQKTQIVSASSNGFSTSFGVKKKGNSDNINTKQTSQLNNDSQQKNGNINGAENQLSYQKNRQQQTYFMKEKERLSMKKKKGETSTKQRKTDKSTPHSSNSSAYSGQNQGCMNESVSASHSSTQGQSQKNKYNQDNSGAAGIQKSLVVQNIPSNSSGNSENNQIISKYIQRHPEAFVQNNQEDRFLEHLKVTQLQSDDNPQEQQVENQTQNSHEKRNSLKIVRKSESYFDGFKEIHKSDNINNNNNNNIGEMIIHPIEEKTGAPYLGSHNFYNYQIGGKTVDGKKKNHKNNHNPLSLSSPKNNLNNLNISESSLLMKNGVNSNSISSRISPNHSKISHYQQIKTNNNSSIARELPQKSLDHLLDHSSISSTNCPSEKTKYLQTLFSQLFVRESEKKAASNLKPTNRDHSLGHEINHKPMVISQDQEVKCFNEAEKKINKMKGNNYQAQEDELHSQDLTSFRNRSISTDSKKKVALISHRDDLQDQQFGDNLQSCDISQGQNHKEDSSSKLPSECYSRQSYGYCQDLLFNGQNDGSGIIKTTISVKTSGRGSMCKQEIGGIIQGRESDLSAEGGTVVYSLDGSLLNHPMQFTQQGIPVSQYFSDYQEELGQLKKAVSQMLKKYEQKVRLQNDIIADQKKELIDQQEEIVAQNKEIIDLKQNLSDQIQEKLIANDKVTGVQKQLQISENEIEAYKAQIIRLEQQQQQQQQSPRITRQPNPIILSPKVIKKSKGGGWGCSASKNFSNVADGNGRYSLPTFSKEMLGRASTDASNDNKHTDCSLEVLKRKYQIPNHKTKFAFTPGSSTSSWKPSNNKNILHSENNQKFSFQNYDDNMQEPENNEIAFEEPLNDSFQMLKQISQSKKKQSLQNTSAQRQSIPLNKQEEQVHTKEQNEQGFFSVNSFSDLNQNCKDDNGKHGGQNCFQANEQEDGNNDNEDILSNGCGFFGNDQGSFRDLGFKDEENGQFDGGHFGLCEDSFNKGDQDNIPANEKKKGKIDNMVNFNVNESFGNGTDGINGEQSCYRRTEDSLIGERKEEKAEDATHNCNFLNQEKKNNDFNGSFSNLKSNNNNTCEEQEDKNIQNNCESFSEINPNCNINNQLLNGSFSNSSNNLQELCFSQQDKEINQKQKTAQQNHGSFCGDNENENKNNLDSLKQLNLEQQKQLEQKNLSSQQHWGWIEQDRQDDIDLMRETDANKNVGFCNSSFCSEGFTQEEIGENTITNVQVYQSNQANNKQQEKQEELEGFEVQKVEEDDNQKQSNINFFDQSFG